MAGPAFNVERPKALRSGVVFASPHSGSDYFKSFLDASVLDEHCIRSSEDAFVDMLFGSAVAFGSPFITAKAPRAFVDLNRAPEELDPALIHGVKKSGHNPRIASGLGVIPRVVAGGRAIYRGKMSLQDAHNRLDTYWRPYHAQLQMLLDQARMTFGRTILIDCHSMPHEAVNPGGLTPNLAPQIVLGDRFGASATRDVVGQIEAAFQRAGFRVSRNAPFAGAFTTQHYGRPSRQQHVVQIEIDRSLYMNEKSITPLSTMPAFQARLRGVILDICRIIGDTRSLAAE
ncbi:MAG: N-formylglutamate amidohydrolase [Pseudomonadota bacterium]